MSADKTKQDTDTIDFKELLMLCKLHWKWFVISMVCCLGISVLYILRQQSIYSRTAAILINEDGGGAGSFAAELNSFADMGLFSSNSNVYNELTAIQSPALLGEVVRRLDLQMNYTQPGTFHGTTLYGTTLPVKVSVANADDNAGCSFRLYFGQGDKVEIKHLKYKDEKYGEVFSGRFDAPIKTPAGNITVTRTALYPKYIAEHGEDAMLYVSRRGYVDVVEDYVARLKVKVDNDKNSILNLTIKDVSIERAENFLNTLIAVYNERYINERNQVALSSTRFIEERLKMIEGELGEVDRDISNYKSEHLVPDVAATAQQYMEQAGEASSQLLLLNNQLAMARYLRTFIKGEGMKQNLLPENSGVGNVSIERQIAEYNAKLLERNNLVATSSVSNPLVKDADKLLASMRGAIMASIDNEISALQTQIAGFSSNERQITSRIASSPAQARYLLTVERQQKVKESLYLYLLQKREENELNQSFTAYNNRLITPPSGLLRPVAPHKMLIMLIGFVAGLLLPAGVIIIQNLLSTKVRGRKDLEKIDVPFLGEIPMYRSKGSKVKEGVNRIEVKPQERNVINEAFRVIRTNIEFLSDDKQGSKAILLTSLLPGSGKTFVSINLAAGFSLQGKRTVIVDLDLRKGTVSKFLGKSRHGVSDYLAGRSDDWHSMVMNVPGYDDLFAIPAGKLPPNPAELLLRPVFADFIAQLKAEFDMVVLDCPPMEVVADTSIIAKQSDISIFVIRAGLMERTMLPVVEEIFEKGKLNNMTVLLNGADMKKNGHGYGYGYGYGS